VSRKTPPLPCLTRSRTSRAGNGQALCMSLADIGSQSLSIRRAVSGSVHPRRPQTISGGGRRQLLTRTRLTANPRGASRAILLKMLNGIPGASTRFYRVANSMDLSQLRKVRDGGFRFCNGIQASVGERGQWAVITHDLISKPTTANQSKRELFRYSHLILISPALRRAAWRARH
jgi:hypothetical protein